MSWLRLYLQYPRNFRHLSCLNWTTLALSWKTFWQQLIPISWYSRLQAAFLMMLLLILWLNGMYSQWENPTTMKFWLIKISLFLVRVADYWQKTITMGLLRVLVFFSRQIHNPHQHIMFNTYSLCLSLQIKSWLSGLSILCKQYATFKFHVFTAWLPTVDDVDHCWHRHFKIICSSLGQSPLYWLQYLLFFYTVREKINPARLKCRTPSKHPLLTSLHIYA